MKLRVKHKNNLRLYRVHLYVPVTKEHYSYTVKAVNNKQFEYHNVSLASLNTDGVVYELMGQYESFKKVVDLVLELESMNIEEDDLERLYVY